MSLTFIDSVDGYIPADQSAFLGHRHQPFRRRRITVAKSKKRKLKLPKRIAGVKIPKAARKGPVADFINSSGGQVLLAEALVLAAGVFGINQLRASSGSAGSTDARGTIEDASARLSYACSEAMKAFRAALAASARGTDASMTGEQDSDAAEREQVTVEEDAPRLKKKKSGTAEATH
jgi:hypothetical protein